MAQRHKKSNVKFSNYIAFSNSRIEVKELTDENTSLKAQICDSTASF